MQSFKIEIDGISPLIMHNGSGIDPLLPQNLEAKEITSKRGSNRTAADEARLKQLETAKSLWLNERGRPTIPTSALRACIEGGAKKLKQGPMVREGLIVLESTFFYDEEKYGTTLEDLQTKCQFTVPVVVQRSRILRTRAKFDEPWYCEFFVETDEELVSLEYLEIWLDIAGRRLGLGDWRPQKSGMYGRFETRTIDVVKNDS